MDRAGIIYVVNENGGGSIDYPQLWVYAPSSLPNAGADARSSLITPPPHCRKTAAPPPA
jgi:hypothetical protein